MRIKFLFDNRFFKAIIKIKNRCLIISHKNEEIWPRIKRIQFNKIFQI